MVICVGLQTINASRLIFWSPHQDSDLDDAIKSRVLYHLSYGEISAITESPKGGDA